MDYSRHAVKPAVGIAALGFLAVALVACGGGGGSNATSSNGSAGGSSQSGGMTGNPSGSGLTADVMITVDLTHTHVISPYIYGLNFATGYAGAPSQLTLDRAGGNRWTAYNWETNASNAGSDYRYENDNYLSSSATPAEPVRLQVAADQALGMATLFTVQMQGLVAGDEAGPVSTANPPDLTRFKAVVFQKSSQSAVPFTLTPPTNDANVYMDEFVWAMDQKFAGQGIFSGTPAHEPTFIELDNEPELWNSTHLEIQGSTAISSANYIAKTISLTRAVKSVFPNAIVFGPVHYGFEGIYDWQGQLAATPTGNNWFPDTYLPAIAAASTNFGHPLVDVYDFHWYSEATDPSGTRITNLSSASLTDGQMQAIVQSPRSLWDSSYTESSWITADVLHGSIQILNRLQSRIDSENPGMRMAITEYNNGGAENIAGTLALADNLGVYGAQNLFAASYWPLSASEPYPIAGFRAYRDFDGAGANFGDVALATTSSAVSEVSAYVSLDSHHAGRVVMVLINRSNATHVVAVSGATLSGTAHPFRITAESAAGQATIEPVALSTFAASGTSLTVSLPAYSVTTLDVH